jgi:hypothetical protein
VIGSNNLELIHQVLATFTRENEALLDQLLQILYYFRGAITREDMWQLSWAEREKCVEFLNKRVEDAKEMIKNHVPVFL